jgi:hypothetical protein
LAGELVPRPEKCKKTSQDASVFRRNGMKALLYPFGPTEPSVQLAKDFPELDWTVVASADDDLCDQ